MSTKWEWLDDTEYTPSSAIYPVLESVQADIWDSVAVLAYDAQGDLIIEGSSIWSSKVSLCQIVAF